MNTSEASLHEHDDAAAEAEARQLCSALGLSVEDHGGTSPTPSRHARLHVLRGTTCIVPADHWAVLARCARTWSAQFIATRPGWCCDVHTEPNETARLLAKLVRMSEAQRDRWLRRELAKIGLDSGRRRAGPRKQGNATKATAK